MLVGEFAGARVQDAKPRVRERMIAAGVAFAYTELEGPVVSCSADKCVVTLMDQWYLRWRGGSGRRSEGWRATQRCGRLGGAREGGWG